MLMRFLVLDKTQRIATTGKFPKRVSRILEEIDKHGYESTFAYYNSLQVEFANDKTTITVDGEDIVSYTHILLGGHYVTDNSYELKQLIVSVIDRWNKENPSKKILVQNARAIKIMQEYTKTWMANICLQYNIPHLKTYFSANRDYHLNIGPLEYPIILKINSGENAIKLIDGEEKIKKNIYLVRSPEDWHEEVLDSIKKNDYIAQEFVDNGEDLRIFVSKGHVIAGWKRISPPNSFLTVTKGSTYLYHNDPTDAERTLAETVARALRADFMAVDIIYKQGKLYVLELSLHPGFNAYETKCLDGDPVNIADALISSFSEEKNP